MVALAGISVNLREVQEVKSTDQTRDDWPEFSDLSNAEWEKQADIRDDRMGDEGNDFHPELVRPSVDQLLAPAGGEAILDIGCGSGNYTRHLARIGVYGTAIDVSKVMIDRARRRTRENKGRIVYKVIDATSEEQLATLNGDSYDAVVSNMTLMDLAEIRPLAENIRSVLKFVDFCGGGHIVVFIG